MIGAWSRGVLALALGATIGLWAWLQHVAPYLGHDESVYAARARSWLADAPAASWNVYRPLGLPALARVALGLAGSPDTVSPSSTAAATVTVRVVGLLLALLTLVIVYLVGARLFGPARGAVAVLVVVGGLTFVRRLPEFLDDIPAAGLLLLAAYLVLRSRRPGVTGARWSLPAAGVVVVAACLVRYGAAAGVLAIAAAGLVTWGPRVWLRAWREVVATAAVVIVGFAPLSVYSVQVTGSPLGIWLEAERMAHRRFLGEGLIFYARAFPHALAGLLGAVVMTAGLLGVLAAGYRLWSARAGRRPSRLPAVDADRERVFLGLAAVLTLVMLGVVAHGEGRFAFFTVFVLTMLGTDTLATALDRFLPSRLPAIAVLAVVAALVVPVTAVTVSRRMAGLTETLTSVDDASAQATRDRAGRECLVITQFAPEAGWLTGCRSGRAQGLSVLPADVVVYVIDFPGAPTAAGLDRVRALSPRRSWTVREVTTTGRYPVAVLAVSTP